jgi:hypothetical protein
MKDKRSKFMNPTAGINEIILGADRHLKTIFSSTERKEIYDKLLYLKRVYSKLDFDPMYLFSIMDNASKMIVTKPSLSPMYKTLMKPDRKQKESVFISAKSRLNSFIEWPEQFKRNTKANLESQAVFKEFKEHPPVVKSSKIIEQDVAIATEIEKHTVSKEEIFELRTQKRPTVETKPLLKPEKDDVLIILLYLKEVIEKDYDIQSIGKAFEIARDRLRKIILQSKFMWEMSKYANLYTKFEEPNLGLSQKEKKELLNKVNIWIENVIKDTEDFIKKK